MSNFWVFCGFSSRNDGFVKVGDVSCDEVYVLFYFFRFFVLIKGKFFLSLTTWHDNRHPVHTETLYGPSSVRINGALLYLIAFTFFFGAENWWGGGREGREWRSENIVWPNSASLVGKTVPYVLSAIPTSFPGFSPNRPFKSYQCCRNCKMRANLWESRDTRGDKAPKPTSLVTTLATLSQLP